MQNSEPLERRLSALAVAVVDNDRQRVSTFRQSAARIGVRDVAQHGSAKAALAAIMMSGPPDVLFVRFDDGSADAIALCRAIRNRTGFPFPFLPLVALCATATRASVQAARDAGVDEFLACPFAPSTLATRLAAVLDNRRGFVDVPGFFGPDRRRGAMARSLGAERRGGPATLIDPATQQTYMG